MQDDPTRKLDTPRVTPTRTSFSGTSDEAHFISGTVLAARYRIVGLLGSRATTVPIGNAAGKCRRDNNRH
jgi:hypothetical protein